MNFHIRKTKEEIKKNILHKVHIYFTHAISFCGSYSRLIECDSKDIYDSQWSALSYLFAFAMFCAKIVKYQKRTIMTIFARIITT